MSKLTRKFLVSIFAILVTVALLSLYLNMNFIQRYFLYREKQEMNRICDQLISGAETGPEQSLKELIRNVEETEDVAVAWVKSTEDNEELNERLRNAFLGKGISLKKYWLWEQDQQDTLKDERRVRIYNQDKLRYSLLVEYLSIDDNFFAVAKIIPSMEQTISLVNQVTVLVFTGAVFVIFILIFVLVRRITRPLKAIGETAGAIAALNFKTVDVRTGDELEELAEDINHMSASLEAAHRELEQKNRQMEELLSNVSHDLKTPVALIKAYAGAMKENMDDGTFLDTIITQNERMEQMIERLLSLARFNKQEIVRESLNVSALLLDMVRELQIQATKRELTFDCRVEEQVERSVDAQAVRSIFSNLLSNAVKYAADGVISVFLESSENGFVFRVENQFEGSGTIDLSRIWEPFYVAEESRNKDMSGTGLGLSIVRAAAARCGAVWDCRVEDNGEGRGKIVFQIMF